MPNELQDSKVALRNRIWAAWKAISPGARAVASVQTCDRLRAQPIWKSALSVLFFAPLPEELDLWPLLVEALAEGRTVALPRFVARTQLYAAAQLENPRTDFRIGQFGIREPAERCGEIPLAQLDLALVPGMAFDLHGRRLGRGRGYYDRLLMGIRGLKCGVAFDEQIVAEVPAEVHDARMDIILTPTQWVKTGS